MWIGVVMIVFIIVSTNTSDISRDPCIAVDGCICINGTGGVELVCSVRQNNTFDFRLINFNSISSVKIYGENVILNENEFHTVYVMITVLLIEGSMVYNNLTKSFLSQFPNVQELVIKNCSLVDIERGAFSGHEHLQLLDISGNRNIAFDVVENGLEDLNSPKLQLLNLSLIHNPVDKETFSIGRLSFNLFKSLANTSLEILDVSWTRLYLFEASALYVPRLKSFNFTGTALVGPIDCFSTFLQTGGVTEVIFDYWPYTQRTLPVYSKPRHKYSVVERCVGSPISTRQDCYRISESLKTVQSQNSRLNTFYIDFSLPTCLDAKGLVNLLLSGVDVSKQFAPITGITNVKVFDLSNPKFTNEHFYFPAVHESMFKSMPSLEVVLLPGNRLNAMNVSQLDLLFANNSKLKIIDISNNSLTSLPLGMFEGIMSLKNLNLSRNELTTIDFEVKNLKRLEVLDLSSNRIKFFSNSITNKISTFLYSSKLFFEYNEFDCDCTINNVISLNVTFLSMSCNGDFGVLSIFKNETIPELPLRECIDDSSSTSLSTPVLIVLIVVSIFVIIFVAGGIFFYRQKTRKMTRNPLVYFYNETSLSDSNRTPRFKAFLAFSHSDELIVFREIMPKLESFLKGLFPHDRDDLLCIYDKHFIPGQPIDEVCEQAVLNSHVIVAIITKGFMNSSWCNFEIKRAYESSIKIIPLYLEECESCEYKGIFKAMFDETIRLKWPHDGTTKEKEAIIKKIADAVFAHVKSQDT